MVVRELLAFVVLDSRQWKRKCRFCLGKTCLQPDRQWGYGMCLPQLSGTWQYSSQKHEIYTGGYNIDEVKKPGLECDVQGTNYCASKKDVSHHISLSLCFKL